MTSERITLHEIKCPNCGATISSFNPFAVACRCPNCDKIFQIVGAAQNPDIPAPERIFPFFVSREQFFERFNAVFWKEFSKAYGEKVRRAAQFGEISAFYVVAYLFRGCKTGSCSCKISGTRPGANIGPSSPFRDLPYSASAKANFTSCVPALEKDRLPEGVFECVDDFRYEAKTAELFVPGVAPAPECAVFRAELPTDFVWEKHVLPRIQEKINQDHEAYIRKDAESLLGVSVSDVSDFRCILDESPPNDILSVLVPVMRTAFSFNGENYYFLCDGLGQNSRWKFPADPIKRIAKREEARRRLAKIKRQEKRDLIGCAFVVLGVIFFAVWMFVRS